MNQELTNKVFSWVESTADKIADWTSSNIPPFITEYLTWKFWESAVGVIYWALGVVLFGILATIVWKVLNHFAKKWEKENESKAYKSTDGIVACTIFKIVIPIVFGGIVFASFPLSNVMQCIKIQVAPKVFLVESAAAIIKENTK